MDNKPGFLMALDMGLGKTVIEVEELRCAFEVDRIPYDGLAYLKVLVVAPNSAKSVWQDHLSAALPPDVPILTVSTNGRQRTLETYSWGVLIVHWDMLRVTPELWKIKWDFVI